MYSMASHSLVCDRHLEQPAFEVRVEAAVKEVLGESEIDHSIILSHYRIHSVVHEGLVLILKIVKHALCRQRWEKKNWI